MMILYHIYAYNYLLLYYKMLDIIIKTKKAINDRI